MTKPSLKELFPKQEQDFHLYGYHFSGGTQYTFPSSTSTKEFGVNGNNATSTVEFKPLPALGTYIKGGMYYMLPDVMFFTYADANIGYKELSGSEEFEGRIPDSSGSFREVKGEGNYNEAFFFFDIGINNTVQLTDYMFIQNTFSVDVKFRKSDKELNYEEGTEVEFETTSPPSFSSSLNYKFGIGIRFNEILFIIPSIQTSVLNLEPYDGINSTVTFFNSEVQPVALTLRLLFLNRTQKKAY